jgi:hypothetical protein
MSLVFGLAGALVVLFVVLLTSNTAVRDPKSSPNVHRLRHWTNRWLW